ncbi:pyridoxamine 5'-phosphate oxidase family protein [Amycolatopsis rhabdoformis]|uniref:Pyridoxamine 5'-phosphate oxidase family protein n=1 Tax=Amycolatopsis rhabdoformis TaxID=1448059 RepID=A0ABZ1IK60_9PSEU|nr:pyridoxamine 5'-phosphate oxidase family protein [Amycolatopsis rhabdoformis]WSE34842.1 pyridoxamine 5'-phosphate oxidase family protein [Amycolatopsis rhabdoformis]
MTEPTRTRNLDIYGHAPLAWSRARTALSPSPAADLPFFLTTVRPNGRPHTTGIGAVWHSDTLYFVSGPGTLKSRLLAANPWCSVGVRLSGLDLTLEGTASRVTDFPTLDGLATVYRSGGWPATAIEEGFTAPYSAPSAGPAPWYVYELALRTAVAVASEEPHGATEWTFAA